MILLNSVILLHWQRAWELALEVDKFGHRYYFFKIFILLEYSQLTLLLIVTNQVYSQMNHLHVYMYLFFFKLISYLDNYRILSTRPLLFILNIEVCNVNPKLPMCSIPNSQCVTTLIFHAWSP